MLEAIRRGLQAAHEDTSTTAVLMIDLDRFKIVKIDRSFIAGIATSRRDKRLCQAIITMANLLRLSVAAEGVELDEPAAQLRTMGCPAAQGDLYSPAVPPTEMTALIGTVFACAD